MTITAADVSDQPRASCNCFRQSIVSAPMSETTESDSSRARTRGNEVATSPS